VVYALKGGCQIKKGREQGFPGFLGDERVASPFPTARRLESTISSPSGVQGRAPEKLILVYFGASRKCF